MYNTETHNSCLSCLLGSFRSMISVVAKAVKVRRCIQKSTKAGLCYFCLAIAVQTVDKWLSMVSADFSLNLFQKGLSKLIVILLVNNMCFLFWNV